MLAMETSIVNWQNVAIFFLGIVVAMGSAVLKHLVDTIKAQTIKLNQLCTNMAVSHEWREGHDRQHIEMRTSRNKEKDEIWEAIDKMRERK